MSKSSFALEHELESEAENNNRHSLVLKELQGASDNFIWEY